MKACRERQVLKTAFQVAIAATASEKGEGRPISWIFEASAILGQRKPIFQPGRLQGILTSPPLLPRRRLAPGVMLKAKE